MYYLLGNKADGSKIMSSTGMVDLGNAPLVLTDTY